MDKSSLLEDEKDDEGEFPALTFPGGRARPTAERVESALEDDTRERAVAIPLTSLSISSVGSRLTNSFCSN